MIRPQGAGHYTGERPPINPVILDLLSEQLHADPFVYVAGELADPEEDGGRIDHHDLFVAPMTPIFEPEALTRFLVRCIGNVRMQSFRKATFHQDGDLQMPSAFVDQHLGNRTEVDITATDIFLGRFRGKSGSTTETAQRTRELIQRTEIRVFPSPQFASTVFEYCDALKQGILDEELSTNLFAIYATHIASPEHLLAAKQAYAKSQSRFALQAVLAASQQS